MRSQSYASTQNAGKALHKKDYAVESTLQLEHKPLRIYVLVLSLHICLPNVIKLFYMVFVPI